MSDAPRFSYDVVDYPSHPLPQAHPDRLATLATLFGLRPAPVERCRVLEIGCGSGGHLLSLALQLPESRFVGVDLSETAIAHGNQARQALGLHNLTLHHADLMEFAPEDGPFDYVIAHGFYSWVPAAVRDRLLALSRAVLAPHGVVYVSYNTLPGCHLRRMLREMMLFHVRNLTDPEERIDQALALTRFLAEGAPRVEGFT